jgi:hypothetical protein
MAWVRFDPGFTQHRKRIDAGPVASWMWVSSVDYCVLHMTDGLLPESAVPSLVPGLANRTRGAAVHALIESHAWEVRSGGYFVHAFLEYQDSADEVRRQREAGKARARRSRDRGRGNAERSGERHAERSAHVQENVRDSAVLSCAVPPLRSPQDTNGLDLNGYARDAFRTDCPDPTWRGRCVVPEHPGPKPILHRCPFHESQGRLHAAT